MAVIDLKASHVKMDITVSIIVGQEDCKLD